MGRFLCYWFGGLILGGAYFRNFMVCEMLQMTLPIAFGFMMWQLLESISLYFINLEDITLFYFFVCRFLM